MTSRTSLALALAFAAASASAQISLGPLVSGSPAPPYSIHPNEQADIIGCLNFDLDPQGEPPPRGVEYVDPAGGFDWLLSESQKADRSANYRAAARDVLRALAFDSEEPLWRLAAAGVEPGAKLWAVIQRKRIQLLEDAKTHPKLAEALRSVGEETGSESPVAPAKAELTPVQVQLTAAPLAAISDFRWALNAAPTIVQWGEEEHLRYAAGTRKIERSVRDSGETPEGQVTVAHDWAHQADSSLSFVFTAQDWEEHAQGHASKTWSFQSSLTALESMASVAETQPKRFAGIPRAMAFLERGENGVYGALYSFNLKDAKAEAAAELKRRAARAMAKARSALSAIREATTPPVVVRKETRKHFALKAAGSAALVAGGLITAGFPIVALLDMIAFTLGAMALHGVLRLLRIPLKGVNGWKDWAACLAAGWGAGFVFIAPLLLIHPSIPAGIASVMLAVAGVWSFMRGIRRLQAANIADKASEAPKEWHEGIDPDIVAEIEEAAHLEIAIQRLRVADDEVAESEAAAEEDDDSVDRAARLQRP
jgi:hypothetical protein